MSSSTPRNNSLQHHSSSPSSSKEEIDLLKRLSELSIKGKHIKSGELLKLLRQLTLFDKDEIEVEFLVSVVDKTFVPLLKSLIGKDSDDSRKVINLLHYFIRRALSTASMLELHAVKPSNKNSLLGGLDNLNDSGFGLDDDDNMNNNRNIDSRLNSNYADENIFEIITNILIRKEVYTGQKVAEINHKHIPRRMEALRTITNIFLAKADPNIQEVIARSLLIYDQATGKSNTASKIRRVSSWKKETDDKWLMSQAAIGCAYRCLLASTDPKSLTTELSLKIVVRALGSNNPATSRHAARFLYEAAMDIPQDIAPILLEQVMPRMPKNIKSTAPPDQLSHEDHFTSTRMLDLYSHLVIECTDEDGISTSFFKAIVVVMCNDRRWRIRLHAARALAHAASKSWNKLQDCFICANDEGEVFDIFMESDGGNNNTSNNVNNNNNNNNNNLTGRTRSKSLETAFNMKLMFSLANMLAEALSIATQIYEQEQQHFAGNNHSNGGDNNNNNYDHDDSDVFFDINSNGGDEKDIRNDFASSVLFFHAILRTIAAVGRQHIRYVFVANHKTNVTNDFTENVIDGTEALRATLTSQISSLTSFSIASIRLQAMLALLWLTPAPSEYHNSQSNEEGASYINDLKHFRTILYSIEEFPREMGREFFHSFKERICLSPSLTPLLLRWYYYPFARNACDIKYIVDLWNTCSDLGPEPRQWTLRQIFSLLDGDHGYYNNNNNNKNDKNRNFYELQEVQRAAIQFIGNFGYELCHPTSSGRKWRSNSAIESLFSVNKFTRTQSMNIAHISKLKNKCFAALMLRLFRYAWFNTVHTRLVTLETLFKLGNSPYASAIIILVVYNFFINIEKCCNMNGTDKSWGLETIVRPAINVLKKRLNQIATKVGNNVIWKPLKKVVLKYRVAQKLKQSLMQTSFGIDNNNNNGFEKKISDFMAFDDDSLLLPGLQSTANLMEDGHGNDDIMVDNNNNNNDDGNWMNFSPPPSGGSSGNNNDSNLLDFDGFDNVSNVPKIDVTNPFAL